VSLAAGDKLGIYEILAPIGAGGMGEVYRARDTVLDREVAIKVLPAALAQHPDRLTRFEREAKVLAMLNHPNIAMIHGLEGRAIVMELVKGPTLADRLTAGAIPFEESLKIAAQIAEALEAAHEKGVVHRDLKPSNVKVRDDGTVKVLDFGLATAIQSNTREPSDGTNSPTLTMGATAVGVILGTVPYMSPEQAAGRPVDRRADIWSFGVVVWEMLTGKRLFESESVSHTLADVLRGEIDFNRLPSSTPAPIRELLKRCLDRDPKTRLRDIGEARIAIQRYLADPEAGTEVPRQAKKPHPAWVVSTALFALAALALALVHFRETPPVERNVRFKIAPPEQSAIQMFKVSPDGRYLAFVSGNKLWVRPLDALQSHALAGTEGATLPFWSPDNAYLAFFAQGKLKKIAATGGPSQTLCDAPMTRGGTWNAAGVILFAPSSTSPLYRVSSAGGVAVPVTKLEAGSTSHRLPEFLPGGQRFLYTSTGTSEQSGIYAGSLDGAPPVRLLPDVSSVVYVPQTAQDGVGYVLFRRETTLMAQLFDPLRLRLAGEVFPVVEQVGVSSGSPTTSLGAFSASQSGVLVYGSINTGGNQSLAWVDRAGKRTELAGLGMYSNFRLAPDQERIAFNRDAQDGAGADIWVLDTVRGVPTRITFDRAFVDSDPVWSPDGRSVIWRASHTGPVNLYVKSATGSDQEDLFVKTDTANALPTDWSRDGRFVAYQASATHTGWDLWIAPQFGDKKPFPYLQSQFDEQAGAFSPDGHWIAYVSNESGRDEVYVQPFPLSGSKFQISTGGGSEPQWRADGTELFYVSADRKLMVVPTKLGGGFQAGLPKSLISVPGNGSHRSYALSNDGQRFLVVVPTEGGSSPPVTVVLNWQAGLHK
jgi:eukaryotic-like serine/threonine-protein kinase